jgi:hypothetical protein
MVIPWQELGTSIRGIASFGCIGSASVSLLVWVSDRIAWYRNV